MQYCQSNFNVQWFRIEVRLCRIGRRIARCNGANWEVNWEVQRSRTEGMPVQYRQGIWEGEWFRIGSWNKAKLTGGRCRIGRCNYGELAGELGGATMENCQTNWEVQRCNIVRSIGRFNGAKLGGELGGATVQ